MQTFHDPDPYADLEYRADAFELADEKRPSTRNDRRKATLRVWPILGGKRGQRGL
jgi:hypothetical protein